MYEHATQIIECILFLKIHNLFIDLNKTIVYTNIEGRFPNKIMRKEVDSMSISVSTIKPIQATPELSGKDAKKLFDQANVAPTSEAVKKNAMLHSVLTNIRKA